MTVIVDSNKRTKEGFKRTCKVASLALLRELLWRFNEYIFSFLNILRSTGTIAVLWNGMPTICFIYKLSVIRRVLRLYIIQIVVLNRTNVTYFQEKNSGCIFAYSVNALNKKCYANCEITLYELIWLEVFVQIPEDIYVCISFKHSCAVSQNRPQYNEKQKKIKQLWTKFKRLYVQRSLWCLFRRSAFKVEELQTEFSDRLRQLEKRMESK